MNVYRASWIVPIGAAPIRDGWVAADKGRVVALGRGSFNARTDVPHGAAAERAIEIDLGPVAVLPGLVNAHTHLEMSWMRGRVGPEGEFPNWIRSVIALRRSESEANASARRTCAIEAIDECSRGGTALVGDISNSLMTADLFAGSPMHAVVFRELIGFRASAAPMLVEDAKRQLAGQRRAPNVRLTWAAHAPYSVSPPLLRAVRDASRENGSPTSVHLGESREELAFLRHGGGAWRGLLDELGVWDETWEPPGCDPAEYLDRLGFLGRGVLCVHGVHLGAPALRRLASRGAVLVSCPRGNHLTGAGTPPVADFYAAGVDVALGTDSLASVPDLNLFSELASLRALAPHVPAARLLESATRDGAKALGWEADFGTIAPGKRAALIAVAVPERVLDVEEYLVSGVAPEQVRWLTHDAV